MSMQEERGWVHAVENVGGNRGKHKPANLQYCPLGAFKRLKELSGRLSEELVSKPMNSSCYNQHSLCQSAVLFYWPHKAANSDITCVPILLVPLVMAKPGQLYA